MQTRPLLRETWHLLIAQVSINITCSGPVKPLKAFITAIFNLSRMMSYSFYVAFSMAFTAVDIRT